MNAAPHERLVLYDGVCGFCDSSVQWLLAHDSERRLQFAALQGATAEALRERFPGMPRDIDTVVFVDEDRIFLRSAAAFAILRHLPAPWSWVAIWRFLPSPLTDIGYRMVAAMRYRIWGKLDACRIPKPEERARFLP
ncbi:thiol-disulfide oxidoreductase [Deltaproteobacteria bacterium]|nr:thiol-disulfide oxidoreductase [Deltaproteobacteria bacterium]